MKILESKWLGNSQFQRTKAPLRISEIFYNLEHVKMSVHPHTRAHTRSGAQLRAGLHKACSAGAQRQNFSGFRAGASGCTFLGNTAFCKGGLHGRRGQDCRARCCPWSLRHRQMLGGQALGGEGECLDACLTELACPQRRWERQTAPRSMVGGES